MAQYTNRRTGDVITVFGPVADHYAADPEWECSTPDPEPEPVEGTEDSPAQPKRRGRSTTNSGDTEE